MAKFLGRLEVVMRWQDNNDKRYFKVASDFCSALMNMSWNKIQPKNSLIMLHG
jgi:hypothetical protein